MVKTHSISFLADEAACHGADLSWFKPSAERLTDLYFSDRYVDIAPDPEPDSPEISTLEADVRRLRAVLFP